MSIAWAALESMAARLAAERATSEELHALRQIFEQFEDEAPAEHMSEYSEANVAFHQTILRLSRSPLAAEMTENLFAHVRAIRNVSLRQHDRATRSIAEHQQIIAALEPRDGELAERLSRDHTLGLAELGRAAVGARGCQYG